MLRELYFWQQLKPAVIVPRYDMLKSIFYDIYLGQDLNLGQDLGKKLHPPNMSQIHDVNKTCLLDVTKWFPHKYPNEANTTYIAVDLLYKNKIIYQGSF